MRPYEISKYTEVIELKSKGFRVSEIVKLTGLTRSCVNNWINRGSPRNERILEGFAPIYQTKLPEDTNPLEYLRSLNSHIGDGERFSLYSYILGMYLGDGNIARMKRTKQLMISLDKKYDKLNEYTENCMNTLFDHKISIFDRSIDRGQKYKANCIVLKYTNVNLGILFPHEGVGAKHLRLIELSEWQKSIIDPVQFIKGLIFSDGCYSYSKRDKYFMYSFCITSIDIMRIFVEYCKIIGVNLNIPNSKRLCIYGKNVKILEELIGNKTNIK